jgi:acetyl esterase
MNNHFRFACSIMLGAWLLFHCPGFSQTCTTGQIDERANVFLKKNGTGQTIAQLRASPIETIRKEVLMVAKPVPKDSILRVSISSNLKINVVKASSGNSRPVILHFHGGGFVTPLMPWMERQANIMAKKLNAVVMDVDYRVAPENKFPAASLDAWEAYLWVLQHAKEYGGNPEKIFLVGTESGANLAALLAFKARKEGKIIPLNGMVLICPIVDNPMISFYASLDDNASGYWYTKDRLQFYFQLYLDKPQWFGAHPEIWPIYEKDFTGLPPALIVTTEFDVLRDEGIAFGKKLEQAGNNAIIKCYPHQLHNFYGLPANSDEWSRVYELMGVLMQGK